MNVLARTALPHTNRSLCQRFCSSPFRSTARRVARTNFRAAVSGTGAARSVVGDGRTWDPEETAASAVEGQIQQRMLCARLQDCWRSKKPAAAVDVKRYVLLPAPCGTHQTCESGSIHCAVSSRGSDNEASCNRVRETAAFGITSMETPGQIDFTLASWPAWTASSNAPAHARW